MAKCVLVLGLLAAGSCAHAQVSVRDVGAAADGKADDTPAFERAFAKSPDAYVPPGTYRVGTLTIPENATLRGAGRASVIVPAAPDRPILRFSSGCRVADLRFDGQGMKARAMEGIWAGGDRYVDDVRLERLGIHDVQGYGIYFDHGRRVTIEGCHIERAVRAIELDFCRQIRVAHNNVRRCSEHGIQFWGNWKWDTQDSGDLTFIGNYVEDGGGGAIWGCGARRVLMSGNTVVRCTDVGLDLEWCGDSVIIGNTVTGALNAGISCFFACDNVAITGNSVVIVPRQGGLNLGIWLTPPNRQEFPRDHGHRDVTVIGNTVRAEGKAERLGVSVGIESENVLVAGNALRGCVVLDSNPPRLSAGRRAHLKATTTVLALREWRFKPDPADVGLREQWSARGKDDSAWAMLRPQKGGWQTQGFAKHTGAGWYRVQVKPAALRRYTYIHFAGADEQAWVYVDGQQVRDHSTEATGLAPAELWLRPFAADVSGRVRAGRTFVVAVRVHNGAGDGGLHRPVCLISSDEPLDQDGLGEAAAAAVVR